MLTMMERTVLVPRQRGRETDRWGSRLGMMLAKHQAVSVSNLWWWLTVLTLKESSRNPIADHIWSETQAMRGKKISLNISWFGVFRGEKSRRVSNPTPPARSDVQKWLNKCLRAMWRYFYVNHPPDETLTARQSLFNNPLLSLHNSALSRKPHFSLCVIQNHSLK